MGFNTGIYLPVRDEACQGPLGEYFLNVYDVPGYKEPHSHQLYLGKDALTGAEDALARADEYIDDMVNEDPFSFHRDITACGASVVRLCTRHEEPVLEVADKVLRVVPGQNPREVVPGVVFDTATSLPAIFSRLEDTTEDQWAHMRDIERINYLPRQDYSGTKEAHSSVTINTGGRSWTSRFGLLGGEETIEFQPIASVDYD